MLARLTEIDGVASAEVDRAGELLRLELRDDGALRAALVALALLGYEAEAVEPVDAADRRWYDVSSAAELSREEAHVIAGRVVPSFARERALTDREAVRLRAAVADALSETFARHPLGHDAPPGSLAGECADAVASAAKPMVGAVEARTLADRVRADMARGQGEPGA